MADIFTHFRNKFERNPELITSKPKLAQALEMSNEEITDYDKWKQSNTQKTMINWVREQFMAHQSAPGETHDGIDFFGTSTTKGFRMHPALTRFSDKSVNHFFNYLKDCVQDANYRTSLSDTRLFGRGYWDETVHRHILKPLSDGGSEFAQISIELKLKDNKLVSLSMVSSVPNNDMPRPSDDFTELMQTILV
jgi:hypothetical protein